MSSRSRAGVALRVSPSPVRSCCTTGSGGAEQAGQLSAGRPAQRWQASSALAGQLSAGRPAQNGGGSLLSSPVCQYVSALDHGGRAAQGSVCCCRFNRFRGCFCGRGASGVPGPGGCSSSGGPCTSDGLLRWGGGGYRSNRVACSTLTG